jgi:catechol 2,3-dioxygenase-like lactoylglutathione lyase family enzyme
MKQPEFLAIHHLKFTVAEIERSVDFYTRVLGARRIAHLDHFDGDGRLYAIILEVPNLGTKLELRLHPAHAATQKGLDPMTLAVESRKDLELWAAHFDAEDVAHSPVLTAYVGWVMVFEDPDGRRLRLYTKETHGPELTPSTDAHWL